MYFIKKNTRQEIIKNTYRFLLHSLSAFSHLLVTRVLSSRWAASVPAASLLQMGNLYLVVSLLGGRCEHIPGICA
jgi:membrane-anchored protein YejM (alkaline phosphatase superfamily)